MKNNQPSFVPKLIIAKKWREKVKKKKKLAII